jgi:hypothetical protein
MRMSRFAVYMNKGTEVTVGEEKLLLKAPTAEHLDDFFTVVKSLKDLAKDGEEVQMQNILDKFTPQTTEAMKNLVWSALKVSYPDEPEDGLQAFMMQHFLELVGPVMNTLMPKIDDARLSKIEELRAKLGQPPAKG